MFAFLAPPSSATRAGGAGVGGDRVFIESFHRRECFVNISVCLTQEDGAHRVDVIPDSSLLASSGPYTNGYACLTFNKPAGASLIIVLSTHTPDMCGAYKFNVFADNAHLGRVVEVPPEGHAYKHKHTLRGTFADVGCGASGGSSRYRDKDKYLIRKGGKEGRIMARLVVSSSTSTPLPLNISFFPYPLPSSSFSPVRNALATSHEGVYFDTATGVTTTLGPSIEDVVCVPSAFENEGRGVAFEMILWSEHPLVAVEII